jgi:hypothetical protein
MPDRPRGPKSTEAVEAFAVRIIDSRDLVISVVPLHSPWRATAQSWNLEADLAGRQGLSD